MTQRAFMDGQLDVIATPFEHQLQNATASLLLHEGRKERLNLIEIGVGFLCALFH